MNGTKFQPLTLEFSWELSHFRRNTERKLHSPWHILGGFVWRLVVFPRGNQSAGWLAVYLECGGPLYEHEIVSDEGLSVASQQGSHLASLLWSRRAISQAAAFRVTLVHQVAATASEFDRLNLFKESYHRFNEKDFDWGFSRFVALLLIMDPGEGFLVNDTLRFKVQVCIKQRWTITPMKLAPGQYKQSDDTTLCPRVPIVLPNGYVSYFEHSRWRHLKRVNPPMILTPGQNKSPQCRGMGTRFSVNVSNFVKEHTCMFIDLASATFLILKEALVYLLLK